MILISVSLCRDALLCRIPRLWPFLSHNIQSVRKAALATICTICTQFSDLSWMRTILDECLGRLYQCCILEPEHTVLERAEEVRRHICRENTHCYRIPNHVDSRCCVTRFGKLMGTAECGRFPLGPSAFLVLANVIVYLVFT